MAQLTWLGEDDLHVVRDEDGNIVSDISGPSFTFWMGSKFHKNVPLEITDLRMITKARGNRFFKVEGGPGRPPKEKPDDKNAE